MIRARTAGSTLIVIPIAPSGAIVFELSRCGLPGRSRPQGWGDGQQLLRAPALQYCGSRRRSGNSKSNKETDEE